MRVRIATGAWCAVMLILCAGAARASSCVDPDIEDIRMTRGATCWNYEGKATHFEGTFAAGQRVRVEMHGISHSYDEKYAKENRIEWEARSPNIFAPDDTMLKPIKDDEEGVIVAVLPTSGKYTFDFSPCSMWHYYGLFRICTVTSP